MTRRDRTSKKQQQSSSSKHTTLPPLRPFVTDTDSLETVIAPKADISTTSFDLSQIGINGTTAVASHPTTDFMPIQTKLTIGEPGDKYEQEADNVAKVVVQKINSPQAQREDEIQRSSLTMSSMTSSIQRQGSISGGTASNEFESNLNSSRSGGSTLEPTIKSQMESAMGADFSGVKVHTDYQADQLSRSIQAKAFTTGQDVFFKQGEYNPNSRSGQELLAHELTHVVQQSGSAKVQRMHEPIKRNTTISSVKSTAIQRNKEDGIPDNVEKYVDNLKKVKEFQKSPLKTQIYNGLTRLAGLKGQTYEDYISQLSNNEFEKECTKIYKTQGYLSNNEKSNMQQDIVVPESYYHVTKSFNEFSGLATTGAATCTALAMSAADENGDCIYAVTHIDADNSIPTVIDGMIKDMRSQLDGTISFKAYISSGSGVNLKNGNLSETSKDVANYLKKQKISIEFTTKSSNIRIGGKSVDDDMVRTNEKIGVIHSKGGNNKDHNGLIQQIKAMPQMKGRHENWENLDNTSDYNSSVHDPMEGAIKAVLQRCQSLEELVIKKNKNQENKSGNKKNKKKRRNKKNKKNKVKITTTPQDIVKIKETITSLKSWYADYAFGKDLLIWAQ
ncbi:DUF4157 domain-containing protein [Leptolyngbya cf. ectocarpi LEGE 11479]|uniref:DUF4157 domain-containing protein n=1 Tax=Leptolyngbya cf. ectocarpi LEGE 11479 TaxID=1828722 RepID=A0A928ZZ32_LEPEC|nr:DUF4157 domain-containing protein [Leptolyngbya ectocarpi]MBE9070076.1 DUF4157 domain-containing protein [Leptolyngbya cf. ectocarpi LEGE 11479]